MATTAVIQTENLTKAYTRGKYALENLNLRVMEGEIFGYLGPNGAGKTTTIRLLLDLIRPDMGHATVLGMDAQKDTLKIRRKLGYLPGELNLWDNMIGKQVLDYVIRVRGGVDANYMRQLIERLGLDAKLKVRQYSTGNKRKLGLVVAMMSKPELLILDEPTNGLDPLVQQTLYQILAEVKAEGRTIFMSSHNLAEVQTNCDRVGILRNGLLKTVESVHQLRTTDFQWVTIRFRNAVPVSHLAGVPGVSDVSVHDNTLRLRLAGDFDPLLRAVGDQYIVDIDTEEPSLEEVFLTFYGENNKQKNIEPKVEVAK